MQVLVARQAVPITFSKEFEALLLSQSTDHISLTHDLELQVIKGLEILEELEDVHDIKHVEIIRSLVQLTNKYLVIDSTHFKYWHINIAEDILDEVELLKLTHGEDLEALGLLPVTAGTIIVLLAITSLTKVSLD